MHSAGTREKIASQSYAIGHVAVGKIRFQSDLTRRTYLIMGRSTSLATTEDHCSGTPMGGLEMW
jgi:hypothetical protein